MMFLLMSLLLRTLAVQAASVPVSTPPPPQGNCQSGRMRFDPTRILSLNGAMAPGDVDPARWDWYVDYGTAQASVTPEGSLRMTLSRDPAGGVALGMRLSSVRTFLHAKLTARMQVPAQNGLVVAFITYSSAKDELDFEWVGSDATEVQTNVFYRVGVIGRWGWSFRRVYVDA